MSTALDSRVAPPQPEGSPNARILVVDDDDSVRGVVAELLSEEGYITQTASGAQEAVSMVPDFAPTLVVTDIKMPEHDGLWLLDVLTHQHPDVAVIMMTGFGQLDTAVVALKQGASDYLTKPVRAGELGASVLRALDHRRLVLENRAYQERLEEMVEEKTKELAKAYEQVAATYHLTLEALVTALDAREAETSNHSQRVVRATLAIAERMNVSDKDLEHFARGALLHDIGKIGVPDHVLLKPGKLTDDEWVEMRKHPETGARILKGIPFLEPALEIVLAHQERWDGGGYPLGLEGEDIPLGARIFAVADAMDAIVSDRPYRRGRPIAYAKEEISRCAGTQFDPGVVQAFLQVDDEEWMRLRQAESLFKPKS